MLTFSKTLCLVVIVQEDSWLPSLIWPCGVVLFLGSGGEQRHWCSRLWVFSGRWVCLKLFKHHLCGFPRDGWMASPTRWTWVWVNSGSWWWTGRPGVLRFMGSQRVGHNWATELNLFSAADPRWFFSRMQQRLQLFSRLWVWLECPWSGFSAFPFGTHGRQNNGLTKMSMS